jgi:hypothetical protein
MLCNGDGCEVQTYRDTIWVLLNGAYILNDMEKLKPTTLPNVTQINNPAKQIQGFRLICNLKHLRKKSLPNDDLIFKAEFSVMHNNFHW